MRTLTPAVAKTFLQNYRSIRDPQSLSYNDGHCGAWLSDQVRAYGFKSESLMAKACRTLLNTPAPKAAFGLFDYSMLPKLNRLLKAHGLRLKQRSNTRQWGDQVEITVEATSCK